MHSGDLPTYSFNRVAFEQSFFSMLSIMMSSLPDSVAKVNLDS